jgi:hypothetical protein
MIDYESFKQAHEYAEKNGMKVVYGYSRDSSSWTAPFLTIAALMGAMKDCGRAAYKYKIGDIVWRLNDEYGVTRCKVVDIDTSVTIDDELYLCEDDDIDEGWWTEGQLYPSREGLIKAQIMHWHGFLLGEPKASCCSVHAGGYEECAREDDAHKKPEECVHEYQNDFGEDSRPRYVKAQKPMCKKCGEFYR